MSLVHADFSCLEEATRMTVNDWLSFGSTTILKSRCSMSWPLLSDLAANHRDAQKAKQMSLYRRMNPPHAQCMMQDCPKFKKCPQIASMIFFFFCGKSCKSLWQINIVNSLVSFNLCPNILFILQFLRLIELFLLYLLIF